MLILPRTFVHSVIGLVVSSMVACGTPQIIEGSERSGDGILLVDTRQMKYTKVEPANELGFAKVVSGAGETYAEGVIDAKGVEITPPRTTMLVDDITGATALVRDGREHLFVDLGNGPVDTAMFSKAWGFEYVGLSAMAVRWRSWPIVGSISIQQAPIVSAPPSTLPRPFTMIARW